jgi:hypothetical protein
MLAGISGSGAGGGDDEERPGEFMLVQAPKNIVSAEAIPRLATERALHDLTMVFPEQNSRPHPSRSQA